MRAINVISMGNNDVLRRRTGLRHNGHSSHLEMLWCKATCIVAEVHGQMINIAKHAQVLENRVWPATLTACTTPCYLIACIILLLSSHAGKWYYRNRKRLHYIKYAPDSTNQPSNRHMKLKLRMKEGLASAYSSLPHQSADPAITANPYTIQSFSRQNPSCASSFLAS